MAIAGIDRYGAASGYQPVDRARREPPPLAPDLAQTTVANTQSVFQSLQPPIVETQRLQNLVASARAASVALEARTDETAAAEDANAAQAASDAAAADAQQTDDVNAATPRATGTDDPTAADDAALAPIDTFSAPPAQDVADSFQAVAALVPTEQTLAPPLVEDEGGVSAVQGVDASAADQIDERLRANAPPGELLSRFA